MEALHSAEPTEVRHTVTLSLTERELEILTGLTDLPAWDEQPEDIREFLADLHDQLDEMRGVDRDDWLGWTSAKRTGFVNETSF